MPTPVKPFTVISNERKSHRTKAELQLRKQAEASTLTGKRLKERKEVKDNPIAHKEFKRVQKLLRAIEKDDGIYESVINRYCLIQSEIVEFEQSKIKYEEMLENLIEEHKNGNINFLEFMQEYNDLQKTRLSTDKAIQQKRKMLFDIEKENIMTIASALRSIPKKVEKKKNPLKDILSG